MSNIYERVKERFKDRDAKSPLDIRHVKNLRWFLSTIGCWPHKDLKGKARVDAILSVYNLFLIITAIMLTALCAGYLHQQWNRLPFFDLGHTVLTIVLDFLFMQRLIMFRTQKVRDLMRDFFLEFHLFYHKHRSRYSEKIYTAMHLISGMFMFYMISLLWVGLFLFLFKPWFNNYSKGMFGNHRPENSTFEHSVYFYSPTEELYTSAKYYWIIFIVNIPNSFNVVCGLTMLDALLSIIVLQIWGHLEIMKHNMTVIPRPDANNQMHGMYSDEENIQVRQLLQDIVVHHTFIIKFVDKCSQAFSEYLFLFYMAHQIISCLLLLEISTLTTQAIAMYGPLTWGMYQLLIQLSILFEITNTKSEQLIQAVYAMPWEAMDSQNRKIVQFLLLRAQTPVSLKAGGMVPVGVRTMSSVLKTSISYYMMLKAVAWDQ